MTIATLNIDWAKSKTRKAKIEAALVELDADILILTEAVRLGLPFYPYVFHTSPISQNEEYDELEYAKILNNETGYRVMIYSKYPAIKDHEVTHAMTSVCPELETELGKLTIYATIVGTQYNKPPWAEKELANCIADCRKISEQTKNLCLAGDLNTSFIASEKLQISKTITEQLEALCTECDLDLTTAGIKNNIDHIFLPSGWTAKLNGEPRIFVEKHILSDHQGIVVTLSNLI